jgi:site-specific DNA-methyltransferase (adenine-specific)
MWRGMFQGKSINEGHVQQGDKRKNEKRIHPTQKPVVLYQWQIEKFAKPGNKILDTHLGSGSSRIAAYSLGFDFWGTEIDEDYYNDQEARFKKYTAQFSINFKTT